MMAAEARLVYELSALETLKLDGILS